MRDVFVEELQIEDLDAFIKDKYKDEDMSYEIGRASCRERV